MGIQKRQYAKELVKQINTDNPGAKKRMFRAILSGEIEGWPPYIGRAERFRRDLNSKE